MWVLSWQFRCCSSGVRGLSACMSPFPWGMWCSCWWLVLPHSGIHLGSLLHLLTWYYTFALSLLVCSTLLHLSLLYMVLLMDITFSLLLLKSYLSQFGMSFTDHWWIVYKSWGLHCQACAPSLDIFCLYSFVASCISTSQGLCCHIRLVFLYMTSSFWGHSV